VAAAVAVCVAEYKNGTLKSVAAQINTYAAFFIKDTLFFVEKYEEVFMRIL
jgi:hypothetical protein